MKYYYIKEVLGFFGFSNTGFEPYSEFYSYQVAKAMEIDAVKYDLVKWKKMFASTCKLFTSKEYSYVQIGDIVKSGNIKDVYDYLKKIKLEEKFEDMILFDAVCLNVDRHFGNFGILRDNKSGKIVDFAPIFDNGESLLCKTSPKEFENYDNFKRYIKKEDLYISYYGVNYNNLVKEFCSKRHIEKLRRLLNFSFEKHKAYNLPVKRIKCLEILIRERAKILIEILEDNK